MNIILLETPLTIEEVDTLLKEFPHFLFLHLSEEGTKALDKEHWDRVEVYFGDNLKREEVLHADQLRWIHSPINDVTLLPMDEIKKKDNILVSITDNPNVRQAGEFIFATLLGFAKHLFHWKDLTKFPNLIWDNKWSGTIWDLKDKTLIQIGLDAVGDEVTRLAKNFGMKVYGIDHKRTFHPNCKKVLPFKELHCILPLANCVVLSLPKENSFNDFFGEKEFELLKRDLIFVCRGNVKAVNEKALINFMKKGSMRGLLIDADLAHPLSQNSPLFTFPESIITPQVEYLPETLSHKGFHNFHYNLRQYVHGNFSDMRELIYRPKLPEYV